MSTDAARLPVASSSMCSWLGVAALAVLAGCGGETVPGEAETATGDVATVSSTGEARLAFETTAHDFGVASDTDELRTSFAFRNIGDEPLEILKVDATCGCTTIKLDRTVFAPGEGDAIEVVWKPQGFGPQRKTIKVLSNAPEDLVELAVIARIDPFLKLEPSVLNFGPVRRDAGRIELVTLLCRDAGVEISSLVPSSPFVAARVTEGPSSGEAGDTPAAEGARATLEVELLKGCPPGPFHPRIDVHVHGRPDPDGEPIDHVHKLQIAASVYNEIAIEPAFFTVGRVTPGSTFTREVMLRRPTGEPFRVYEASVEQSTLEGVSVKAEDAVVDGKPAQRLVLSGEVGDYLGSVRGQVVVKTDVPQDETLTISFMGLAR